MKMTKEMITNSIKNKINWSLPGKDKITNYWIKKMHTIDGDITTALNTILTERLEISAWLMIGRSVTIRKRDDPSASDH